jgi:hypothetical protein
MVFVQPYEVHGKCNLPAAIWCYVMASFPVYAGSLIVKEVVGGSSAEECMQIEAGDTLTQVLLAVIRRSNCLSATRLSPWMSSICAFHIGSDHVVISHPQVDDVKISKVSIAEVSGMIRESLALHRCSSQNALRTNHTGVPRSWRAITTSQIEIHGEKYPDCEMMHVNVLIGFQY